MHILAGLDKPTAGTVAIAGTEITTLDDRALTMLRRKHIGFVFQFFNLLPMLTAEENILLPLSIAGVKPDRAWMSELIAKVGLDAPSAGSISGGGQRIDQLGGGALAKWRASNVGFIFQFYNLMPMLSAQRNVELPLLLTKLSAAQRRKNASIALQLVGLADRASHKPGELSGGQQQRVAIARAIVSDPTLLVCDEPTGDLDRQSAEDVLGLLRTLNREHGKTIVMVTHDPKAAEYANHTLHLDKGTLVEQALA